MGVKMANTPLLPFQAIVLHEVLYFPFYFLFYFLLYYNFPFLLPFVNDYLLLH